MRIVAISGVLDNVRRFPGFWKNIENAFKEYFPGTDFVLYSIFYFPWEIGKMKRYANKLVKKFDDGEDVILLGHSMGGIIATIIAPRFRKSKVKLLVTINSPHKLKTFYEKIDKDFDMESIKMPVASFSSVLDPVVPFFMSKHPKSNIHRFVLAEHVTTFLFFPKLCEKLAKFSREVFDK